MDGVIEIARLGLEKVTEQAVEKRLPCVADDPSDLAAPLRQDKRRRCGYWPIQQDAGSRLISNVNAPQGCYPSLGREWIRWTNFGVPPSAPSTIRVLEHHKLDRARTAANDERSHHYLYGESYPAHDILPFRQFCLPDKGSILPAAANIRPIDGE
jgi:hypothetical protein